MAHQSPERDSDVAPLLLNAGESFDVRVLTCAQTHDPVVTERIAGVNQITGR
jgi:hypothetical protein